MGIMRNNCLCFQDSERMARCDAADSSLPSCVVSLSVRTNHPPCHQEWCRFPTRDDWNATEFLEADDPLCEDTIGLKYWHICYDCLLPVSTQPMVDPLISKLDWVNQSSNLTLNHVKWEQTEGSRALCFRRMILPSTQTATITIITKIWTSQRWLREGSLYLPFNWYNV